MFKTIALAIIVLLAVAVVVVLILAASKPDVFRVARSTSIKAPPDKIYALINDFHQWTAWSPYEKKDPDMKRTFSGAASGKGAAYEWEGDKNVGKGRMEIADTSPSRITIKLDMLKPFEAHNTVVYTLEPRGDSTNVTWAMEGQTPFLGKVIHVFIDMDKMVGRDFEDGLASLKTLTEK